MKIVLLQCDVKDQDLAANADKLLNMIANAEASDLYIAPAGALTGPNVSIGPGYAQAMDATLNRMSSAMPQDRTLLCYAQEFGYILLKKEHWHIISHIFEFGGMKMGVDLHPDDAEKIDVAIAMQERPFYPRGAEEWELIFSGFCRQANIWGVSVNLCGGYGSNIYTGQSFAIAPDGSLAAKARACAEDVLAVDMQTLSAGRVEESWKNEDDAVWQALTLGLRDFVHKNGASKVILGLSGGMDSALVACIAADALGNENVTGILMPSPYTSDNSIGDAKELAKNLKMPIVETPVGGLMDAFASALAPAFASFQRAPNELTNENLQARLRGVILMALANYSGALVLNCGNKSEASMGYCTLYGDTVGAVSVIGDLTKTQVYKLGRWFCKKEGWQIIPDNIFTKEPTAELRPNQKDTDSLPPYDILDAQLEKLFHAASTDKLDDDLLRLAATVRKFAFKRNQSPPILRVASR